MKQFGKILKFELNGYYKNKVFVGVTVFLVVVLAVVLFFPRVSEAFRGEDSPEAGASGAESDGTSDDGSVMLIYGGDESVLQAFTKAFPDYDVRLTDGDIPAEIRSGEAECGFSLDGLTSYVYYVDNLSMYDSNTMAADEVLLELYRASAFTDAGLPESTVADIMSTTVIGRTENLGVNQMQNFFYTYVMIMALYMVILLYGQMVATNVATEKSSRAMELLITSARPTSMMFGKVIASCIAGLTQLVCVFGAATLFFNLNRAYWEGGIIASIFDMPLGLLIYMLLFFVLGFFIYAFMYGAIGSTASKLEDINTSVMPVTLIFIAGFLVVVFSMSAGEMNNTLMKICSFIPFTSPMAMFTRIAMSTVPFYEIIIAVVILIGSAAGIGVVAAKIYRTGVLLYGTTPKIREILRAVRRA